MTKSILHLVTPPFTTIVFTIEVVVAVVNGSGRASIIERREEKKV